MAVTDSPRLGLTRWGAGTDPLSRLQLDGDHAALDDLVAIDLQGTLANRPAAGIRGRYYFATDNGLLYRDDGVGWTVLTLLLGGTPSSQAFGDAAAAGAATTAARLDHKHGMPAMPTAAQVGAIPTAGGTYTGTLTNGTGGRLLRPVVSSVREEMSIVTTTGATIYFAGVNAAARNVYRLTYAGAVTVTWADIPAAGSGLAVAATLICVGPTSITWPAGTKFNGATAPAIDGQTWFSCVAQEGVVTVGTSFAAVA